MLNGLRKCLVGQSHEESALPLSVVSNELQPEEVLHDAAARFLDAQTSTLDVLDNRTVGIFTVASTTLLLTFGLFDLTTEVASEQVTWLLRGALVSYLFLLLFAWRGSRIRALEYRPDLATLLEHSETLNGNLLRLRVAIEYLQSTEINQKNPQEKARWIAAASSLLFVKGFLLSAAVITALLL